MGVRRAPTASSPEALRRMQLQRQRDTQPERAIRQELHRQGLRFRLHRRPLEGLRREADIVFSAARVAIFIDGCFWHGCPDHATWPKENAEWWQAKIEDSRVRDRETDRMLAEAGWSVIRVWEHENPIEAAARIAIVVRARAKP